MQNEQINLFLMQMDRIIARFHGKKNFQRKERVTGTNFLVTIDSAVNAAPESGSASSPSQALRATRIVNGRSPKERSLLAGEREIVVQERLEGGPVAGGRERERTAARRCEEEDFLVFWSKRARARSETTRGRKSEEETPRGRGWSCGAPPPPCRRLELCARSHKLPDHHAARIHHETTLLGLFSRFAHVRPARPVARPPLSSRTPPRCVLVLETRHRRSSARRTFL